MKKRSKVKALIEDENYENLVKKAENAYGEGNYLEAFLIQACIIEGVLKHYTGKRFENILSSNNTLKNKFSSFELARLTDELFIAGKIDEKLYNELDKYRKKRNEVIHNLLKLDQKSINSELRQAYQAGRNMKVLIIDELRKDLTPEITLEEMKRELDRLKQELEGYNEGSRTHTATKAQIYNLLLEMMGVADSA